LPENLLNGCETLGASVYDKKELDGLDPVMWLTPDGYVMKEMLLVH
jgi:hypothetical protein